MSRSQVLKPASEMSVADLIAFEGLEFGDQPCTRCGQHLGIDGIGVCVMCVSREDIQRKELLAFDPDLSDVLEGRGAEITW